jgi:hypothetical protein
VWDSVRVQEGHPVQQHRRASWRGRGDDRPGAPARCSMSAWSGALVPTCWPTAPHVGGTDCVDTVEVVAGRSRAGAGNHRPGGAVPNVRPGSGRPHLRIVPPPPALRPENSFEGALVTFVDWVVWPGAAATGEWPERPASRSPATEVVNEQHRCGRRALGGGIPGSALGWGARGRHHDRTACPWDL